MTASLALITCGPQLEVSLFRDGMAAASVIRLAGAAPRSRLLLAAADLLLEDLGITPRDLDEVVVSRGPGSFTGIRAGLASAAGLAAATSAETLAYDSLTTLAARCSLTGTVWAAQPGRRGELYARRFEVGTDTAPKASGPIEVVPVAEAAARGPWVAAEALDLGGAERGPTCRSAAEALLELRRLGVPPEPLEPLYFEGPPVHPGAR